MVAVVGVVWDMFEDVVVVVKMGAVVLSIMKTRVGIVDAGSVENTCKNAERAKIDAASK